MGGWWRPDARSVPKRPMAARLRGPVAALPELRLRARNPSLVRQALRSASALTQMMSRSTDQCQTQGRTRHSYFWKHEIGTSTDTMPSASRISLPRLSPSSAIVTLHYQFQSAVESSTSSAGGTPPRSDDSDRASVYERAAGDPQYRSSVGRGFIYRLHQERPVGCSREENFGWARNQHEHKGLLRSARDVRDGIGLTYFLSISPSGQTARRENGRICACPSRS